MVEISVLLRIFTITHWLFQIVSDCEFFRFCFTNLFCEIFRNQSVVSCCVTEDLSCQTLTRFKVCFTISCQFIQNNSVISWVNDNCNTSMVFSSRAKHRRTTDINVFNCIGISHIWFQNSFFEWVKVNHNKVNQFNVIIFCSLKVAVKVATSQKAAVNIWMKCFHTTVHHFRKTSHIINRDSLHTCFIKHNLSPTS